MNEGTRNEIIHRWQTGQSLRSIARALNISRHMVKRAVEEVQQARAGKAAGVRTSKSPLLDPYEETIRDLLRRYPRITATRLLEELHRAGYQGSYTILRQRLKQLRVAARGKPVERFETEPGRQAQMDWATYTLDFTVEGRRRVNLFSYVLGYSRRQYLRFTDSQDFETTIRQHVRAFEHLGGIAAECLYDNMKVVVDRLEDDEAVYNARFLSFATHYGFRPRACRVRRPQTKGKVERPFYYVETNLLNGRTFTSLEHLNEVTAWWLAHVADVRLHRELKQTPLAAHAQELPHLLPLPEQAYDTARVVYRVVDVEGLVSFQNNAYSVPWRLIGQTLPLRISERELIVYDGQLQEVARHPLLERQQRGQRVVQAAHRPAENRREQTEQLRQRFDELGEPARRFFDGLAQTQAQVNHQARKTLALMSLYHRRDVLAAMERAVRYRAFSWQSLERILAVRARPKTGGIARRIQQAGFRDEATLESFDWKFNAHTIDRVQMEQLATGDFVRRGDNLVFAGQSGLGKSHLIQAIGRSCCVPGYRVCYRTSAKLLSILGQSLADGTTPKLIRQYARYDLLIIDEFGFDKLEREGFPQASSLLYKVIDSRTRARSTALVTNIDFESWGDYLGDPPLAMAFLDRVVDGAIILKFRGQSYRAHRARKPASPGGKS